MAIDPSMEPMLEVFIYETTTLLDQLDEILLASEKEKHFSDDNINEIFRIMHTIKGSSAMMEFNGISTLAHAVEDVFYIIRNDPSKMAHVSESIFDLVFQASDFFKEELESVQNTGEANKDPQEIIAQLEEQAAILKGEAPQPAAAPEQPPAPANPQAPAEGALSEGIAIPSGMFGVRIFFEDGCQMENIRAFMLMTQLKDWCDGLDSIPRNPENDASLCQEIIDNGFIIFFKPSTTPEDVYKVIEGAVNVKSYEALGGASSEPQPAPEPAESEAPAEKAEAAPVAAKPPENAPTAAKPAAKAPAPAGGAPKVQSLISVNQTKLDQLMDLVGELVTTESMVSSNPDLKGLKLDNFHKSTRELRKLTDELQDVVMSIRMVPLSGVFQKMNRLVRDMGKKLDKLVELQTIGGETEVDKTINDSITDPLMHMVRNSVDHAIEPPEVRRSLGKPETGRVTLAARNVGGEIVITVADDGSGLDADAILQKAKSRGLLTKPESEYSEKEIYGMIMLPGFSTNEQVTEYSGRGVGMDVVRKNIEKVGGSISIESTKNVGTTFTIKIPLTLAIVDGMELSVGDTIFTLSITSIKQSFKVFDKKQILHNTDNAEMIMLRGECYPIIRLHELFDIPTQITDLSEGILILVENSRSIACIFADELLGEQQVVVKPFPTFLNKYNVKQTGLSGCTILGDGSISLILDANNLLSANV